MKRGRTEEMKSSPELSLVMPAYNEADTIEVAVNRIDRAIKQTGLKYELIVVDDGSVDDTRRRAMNFANNNGHTKVVSYAKNIGKGHAIRTGFAHTRGDAVVFMDSDLDIDPKQIARYAEALRYGDIVIASKWHSQSRVNVPLVRRLLSHSFNVLVKLLVGVKVSDTQTGLKAFKRNVMEKVLPMLAVKRYAFDVEVLAVANILGFRTVELPVSIRVTRSFSVREGLRMLLDLLGIAYRLRIVKFYQRPSWRKL